MVKKSLFSSATLCLSLSFCILVLSSCGQDKGPQEKADSSDSAAGSRSSNQESGIPSVKGVVSATDTANAQPVTINTDSLTMGYRVKVGDVFSYKVTQHNRISEGKEGVEDNTEYYYTKRITAVLPDSSITLTMRFDRIVMKSIVPSRDSTGKMVYRSVHYNSADAADRKKPNFMRYTALIGHEAVLKITPRGDVIDISKVEPVAEKIIAAFNDSLTSDQKKIVTQEISLNAYAMVHRQEFQVYPQKPLDASRTWTANYEAPLAGIFSTENVVTYKLDKVINMKGRNVAEIIATLKSKVLEKTRSNTYGTIALKNGNISGGSKHLVDLDKGFTIFKKYNLSIDVEVATTDNQTKQSQTTKQKTSSDITVELL
jgi:hypothetical protein